MRSAGGKDILAEHAPERPGHEHHSRASIEKISRELGYEPTVRFDEGLGRVYMWYEKRMYVVD